VSEIEEEYLQGQIKEIGELMLKMNDPKMGATQVQGLSDKILEWMIRNGFLSGGGDA